LVHKIGCTETPRNLTFGEGDFLDVVFLKTCGYVKMVKTALPAVMSIIKGLMRGPGLPASWEAVYVS